MYYITETIVERERKSKHENIEIYIIASTV